MNPILLNILSVILGCILPLFCKLIIFLFTRQQNRQLCGNFYGYICYFNFDEPVISRTTVIIKKKLFYDYYISLSDEKYHYIGNGYIENGFLCVNMKSIPNSAIKETTFHRYYISRLLETDLCFGIWLSTDVNNKITCGGSILSRTQMNDEDIKTKMKLNFYIDRSLPIISLR